jgi:hypothetical protein
VGSADNASSVGKMIMRDKVFNGSFKKSIKLKQQMAQNLFVGNLPTALGQFIVPIFAIDREIIDRFFVRLTKGLLATFYPSIDYFVLQFKVNQLNQYLAKHSKFKDVASQYIADERGDGIFRFWRCVSTNENRVGGIWIYQFYDAALFILTHGDLDVLIKQ